MFLSILLPTPLDDTAEHVNGDVLADLGLFGLVLRVLRNVNDAVVADLPAAGLGDKGLDLGFAAETEVAFEDADINLTEGETDELGDLDADDLLETLNVGGEVRVDVVALEGGPEVVVSGALEVAVERSKLGDSLGEVGRGAWAGVGV